LNYIYYIIRFSKESKIEAIEFETKVLNGIIEIPANYEIDSTKKVTVIILFKDKVSNPINNPISHINDGSIELKEKIDYVYSLTGKFKNYDSNSLDFISRKQIEKKLE
jgi:hypothetical protein